LAETGIVNDIIDPEVLPPGGPVPRRSVEPDRPAPPIDWTTLVGAALTLDLLGLFARRPFRIITALIGAGIGAWLTPKLRLPLRFAGWMGVAGALYASWTKIKFWPVALVAVVIRMILAGKKKT
jgi:hypothetical protein